MRDLAVVMPVYNEAECIADVVQAWLAALATLKVDAVVCVYDDGSTDDTPQRLAAFAADPRVRVTHHDNRGHGPTILRGYQEAVTTAAWVFQCDSDGEISPAHFADLWRLRADLDLGAVVRVGRRQNCGRRAISMVSRGLVGALYGVAVKDANAPYRLLRASWLAPLLPAIPPDTFAPNLLISGAASVSRARVATLPVQCLPRATGRSSIVGWRALRAALRSFVQTVRCRRAIRAAALPAATESEDPDA